MLTFARGSAISIPSLYTCSLHHLSRTHLFANTGSGRASVNDKEGDTTTVLNVGKYENNKSTVALSTEIMKINH